MYVNMGIIKIEVNLPEAVQAIEEFRRNRIRAFEVISGEFKAAVGGAINHLLQTEMTLFLGKPEQSGNKRNGYKERDYALKGVGCIRIRMPQDRRSEFKSTIVAPNEQIDPRLKEDMAVLHLAGLSTRTMAMVSKRVMARAIVHQANKLELWIRRDLGVKSEKLLKTHGAESNIGHTYPSYSATAERGTRDSSNFCGTQSNLPTDCGGTNSSLDPFALPSAVTHEERSSSKVKLAGTTRIQ